MKNQITGKINLIFLVILIIFFIFVCLWKSSSIIISPRRFHGSITPEVYGLSYKEIEFTTEDSIPIKGWYILNKISNATIILLHGFGVDKSDLLDVANFLFQQNFSVLLFDFRAHGYSGGKYCSLGHFEKRDLKAAVSFLKDSGEIRIGVMGFSMGGTVALLEASKNSDILAVVSDCGYLSFRSAVRDFAKCYYHLPEYPFIPPVIWLAGRRLGINPNNVDLSFCAKDISPTPILIIHSRDDKEIRLINATQIYKYAKEPKELWVVDEAEHLGAFFVYEKEYKRRVISFFKKYLF